jgi:A/G-specific adenine glycosylase
MPKKSRKKPPRRLEATAGLLERRNRVLLVRRPPSGLLGGLWELPGGELAPREAPAAGLARSLRERVGLVAESSQPLGRVKHVFTHRELRLHVFRVAGPAGRVRLDGFDAHRWVPASTATELPVSAATRKALALALDVGP